MALMPNSRRVCPKGPRRGGDRRSKTRGAQAFFQDWTNLKGSRRPGEKRCDVPRRHGDCKKRRNGRGKGEGPSSIPSNVSEERERPGDPPRVQEKR